MKKLLFKILFQKVWNEFVKQLNAKDEQNKNLKRQINYLYLELTKLQIERHIK